MALPNNPSSRLSVNKGDMLSNDRAIRGQYQAELKERLNQLRDVHVKERQDLSMQHGNNLNRIANECSHEPQGLQELRTRSCTNRFERERDALTDVQERMELYREVKSKQDFEGQFPGHEYPSKEADNILEKRADRFDGMEADPKTDRLHLNQEREHDLLVKSYLNGDKNYSEFAQEYDQMSDRHLAGSTPVVEKQLEPLKHRNPKAPEIEPD